MISQVIQITVRDGFYVHESATEMEPEGTGPKTFFLDRNKALLFARSRGWWCDGKVVPCRIGIADTGELYDMTPVREASA